MCGFAGFIDFHNLQPSQKIERSQTLAKMGQQLSRRGPDDEQLFDVSPLSLVFRRLSIIDINHGQQPIMNEDGTILVVVNGEIYNHLELRTQLRQNHNFRTQSDAEVVLHLYEEQGVEALSQLNGMFAITLWDMQKQRLLLARDRLGIKPLYYAQVGSELIFSSTLMSLLVHPNAPRQPQYQDLTNISCTTSFVSNVHRLAGGHYLLFDAETHTATPQNYWNLENYFGVESATPSRTDNHYIREYGELFLDSVKKRLMSDVPVGAFLSGGLDSGAIVAAASQFGQEINCFSIMADYTIENGDIAAAQQCAKDLQLPFHPVFFDSAQLLSEINFSLETFEYFIWLIDSPKFILEWVFKHELHRYAKTLNPNLKVILLGQGADEFAGGYSTPEDFPNSNWQEFEQKLSLQEQQAKESSKGFGNGYPESYTLFQKETLQRIHILQNYNLWHEDRSSMSQSIEARVPFLDHRLVEYLASIPTQHHEALFWNKRIIREMARQWLPDWFIDRKKSHAGQPKMHNKMKYQILQRIFPEFREKYLDTPNSLFPQARIVSLYEQADYTNPAGLEVVDKLIGVMAMSVFQLLCQNDSPPVTIDYLYGQSSLRLKH